MQPNMSYQNLRFLITEMFYRRNFNHLIRNTHFKTLFYHHGSTYSTLMNMSALQCPDVQTYFLSEHMLGRWVVKIKKCYPFLQHVGVSVKRNFLASISGQEEVKLFLLIASAKYSFSQIKVLNIL